jgi:antitoxin component YwqK of YwqJK toxin-antitoxin module
LGYKPILDDGENKCLVAVMKAIHIFFIFSIFSFNAIFAEEEPNLDDPKVQDQIIEIAAQKLEGRTKGNGYILRYLPFRQVPYTGWEVSFYANGQVKELCQYKNGKPDGLFRKWRVDGEKQIEGNYKDGKRDGLYTEWFRDGLKREENYKDGKRDGLYTEWWFRDGQKNQEGNYKDGKKDGLWFFYNEDGTVDFRENYKDGEEVKD